MNDETETANGHSAEDVARDVHIELTLAISCHLTHGELKEMADEGEDISEDDLIAKYIATDLEDNDNRLLDLLQEHGFIVSKTTVNISMPEKD